ncbi:myo-inosose-2 dehydratase [Paenibacillus dakarensis]|uniref:myo-inosose-2 dehydratase n=1 Tax=Paenibacillus dakarensis TaxID=1527293 RepID=UPI0006D55F00|nr:myo-inosose-2 dehydratase [Paenibacillus dakarensis]
MIYRTFRLGIHPINWVGEDVAEHGSETTFEDIMADIGRLGLTGTEMGRKYPKEAAVLKEELGRRGIQLVSQWKSVFMSDPERRKEELAAYRQHAEFLKELGAKVISTAEIGGSLHWDPRRSANEREVRRLTDEEWNWFIEGLHQAGEIAREFGMKLTYHHHGGTVVERPEEIDRLMESTDPELVSLLYDTGHAYYGGYDPLQLLTKHYDRIAYVHLKDVRQSVLEQGRTENWDFVTCIRKGVFTVPGDGDLEFAPVIRELNRRGYNGWAMLEGEQDPAVHPPYDYARNAILYLDSLIRKEETG